MFDNINTNTPKKDSSTSGGDDKIKVNNRIAPPPIPPKLPAPGTGSPDNIKTPLLPLSVNKTKFIVPKPVSPPVIPTPPPVPNIPDKKKENKRHKGVEDIFADTETGPRNSGFSKKPDIFKPKDEVKPAIDDASGFNDKAPAQKSRPRKLLFLAVLIVGLVVIVVGGILGYKILTEDNIAVDTKEAGESEIIIDKKKEPEQPIVDINKNASADDIVDPEIKIEPDVKVEKNPEPPIADINIDSDQDGLSDIEEIELGTDINSRDSDNDNLFDREEVQVYKTDPLNPDTDGDGYLDGDEVNNSFNPKGAGKLYKI